MPHLVGSIFGFWVENPPGQQQRRPVLAGETGENAMGAR